MTKGYDGRGKLTSLTDALGRATQYGYDGLNRRLPATDAIGAVTQYGYDVEIT